MLQLHYGCSCSKPTIHPANWKTGGKSLLNRQWYLQYWFRDPSQNQSWHSKHPYGQCIRVKFKRGNTNLEQLRAAAKGMLENEIYMLVEEGYNPITKTNNLPAPVDSDIPPTMPFVSALRAAERTIKVGKGTQADLRSVLRYTESAARALQIDRIPIEHVKRKHIKLILEHLGKTKSRWTGNTHNWYRSYLNMIFNEIIEYEAIENNPVWKVAKQKVQQKIRLTLSKMERGEVDAHLRKKKMTAFRLYMRLFFHSGIRSTEMLQLKGKDVDISNQLIRVRIKKGRYETQVDKTIKNLALPYWKLALKNCGPEDYIFSEDLKPGSKAITAIQISRRWRVHVKAPVRKDKAGNVIPGKGGLGIKVDFYAYKHANTTEMVDLMGADGPAALNSHKGNAMVVKIYDVKRVPREHEKVKNANNGF